MRVNNNEIESGSGFINDGKLIAYFHGMNVQDVCAFGETAVVELDGTEYTTTCIESVHKEDTDSQIVWLVQSNTEVELAEANAELTAIKNALSELGDGVTLTKLKTFMTAVKEAVGYDE